MTLVTCDKPARMSTGNAHAQRRLNLRVTPTRGSALLDGSALQCRDRPLWMDTLRKPGRCTPARAVQTTISEERRMSSGMSAADRDLRTLLGADPPASVLALDDATRADLAAVIAQARKRQAMGLKDAYAATLKHVPFPVRGIVKKVLGV
jgi:hypothetical protein